MRRIINTLLISLAAVTVYSQEIAQWRGPNRDGVYNEKGLLRKWPEGGPRLIWHFDKLGQGHTSAAVTANAIYTTGMINDKGIVFSFDHNGKLLWQKEYGTEWTENWFGVRSTPLIYDKELYIMSSFGKLLCMNASNGQVIWTVDLFKQYDGRNIQWGVTENLLADGNMLFVTPGGTDANVLALDRITGKLIWKSKGNGEKSGYCSPILVNLSGRKIFITMMEKSIMGLDASDGRFLWKHEQTNQWSVHPNIPIYKDGYLFCTSGYGRGGVMLKLSPDGNSVTEVWRNKSLDPRTGGVVLLDGKLYGAGDYTRKLLCLDWKTGKELYSANLFVPGTTIANDGLLYVYGESGKIGLIEPKDDSFNVLSSFKVPFGADQHWANLVIYNKRLYVRHGTSLMVYDIAGGQ
jgi:outer membrane protein assembly factor BamB